MDLHQEWLNSEREKNRRSSNFTRGVLLAKPFLILLFLPAFIFDVTQALPRIIWAVYLGVIFLAMLLSVRKLFSVGSVQRYVANYITIMSGIMFPLAVTLAVAGLT